MGFGLAMGGHYFAPLLTYTIAGVSGVSFLAVIHALRQGARLKNDQEANLFGLKLFRVAAFAILAVAQCAVSAERLRVHRVQRLDTLSADGALLFAWVIHTVCLYAEQE